VSREFSNRNGHYVASVSRCLRARACLWSREGALVGALLSVQGGPVRWSHVYVGSGDDGTAKSADRRNQKVKRSCLVLRFMWERGIAKPGYKQRKVDRGLLEI
jgi:hypothetical protein